MSRLFNRMFRRDGQWRHFRHELGGLLTRELDSRPGHDCAQLSECERADQRQ
jgi:hypothetical protein